MLCDYRRFGDTCHPRTTKTLG